MGRRSHQGILCFVGGINGVGKSTLISEIEKIKKYRIIHGSALLMERMGLDRGDYDSLRKLPDKLKDEEWDKAMNYVIETSEIGQCTLIDSHYSHIKLGVATKVLGDWVSGMDGLFLISANPSEICRRIDIDVSKKGKKRNIFINDSVSSVGEVEKYLSLEMQIAQDAAANNSIPFFVINNDDGKLMEARDRILKNIQCLQNDMK